MKVNWEHVKAKLNDLTEEERRIVDMLAAGDTLPTIGKSLGQHRSRIWRKVEKIKARLLEA
jgi:DNA-binding CsgD family transcriptional regulator